MNLKYALAPAAALVALSLTAMPADAQQRRGNGGRGGGAQMAPRASAPQQRATPRQAQPRANAQQPRSSGQQPRAAAPQPRGYVQQPRSYGQQPRAYGPQVVPRQGPMPRAYDRGYAGRAPSYGYGYGGDLGRRAYVAPRGGYGNGYGYGYGYRPYYYSRPYYVFRPRVSLGFGLWIGFPTAYPFYSYGYANPTYGYPLSTLGLAPGAAYGGISFEIDPYDAAIYVDGDYVGIVSDFGPNAQPLTLRVGTYRVEIQATGYAPIVWDVNVIPGQVIPYRGAMQRY